MEEKEQQAGETTPPEINIPWFKRWEDKDSLQGAPYVLTASLSTCWKFAALSL